MSLSDSKVGTAVAVSDMSRARSFYEDKLGLESNQASDEMAAYECGGGTGLFVYVSEHAGSNKATLAGFEVSDFDATRAELSDKGVEFERYDDESGVTTNEDGVFEGPGFRAAWFKDPDGNTFAINEAS
jgi:catechol 2,3-dioxygenase-like lactoylglutathione lyase family enzyme